MRKQALFTAIALLGSWPAAAHHSVPAEFDTSQQADLEGEITQVWFTNPHARLVERYEWSADRLSMDRTMTIYDPYYTAPLVRRRGAARGDDLSLTEQAPCDPDSYYRDLDASGRLQEHLNR